MSALELSPVRYSALCLTHNCNLRCKYCYAGPKTRSSMSFDTGRRAMDFLASASNGSCTITFFGGEPLLEFELIRRLVEYGEDRYGRKLSYRMSTNGTLLRRSTLDYCRRHDIYFVLSIDGNQQQHDANRRFAAGAGSYDSIVRRLDAVLDFNPYTMAVSVLTPETAGMVASGVEHLFRTGFRYVLQTLDYSAQWENRDIKTLEKQYAALARYYYDALRSGKKIYYSPFDERIKTWAKKPYGKGDLCDLAHTQIAIAPSGRIYPCVQFIGGDGDEDQAQAIGNVFDGFDQVRRRRFIEENYADKESCSGCALAGRCATFCAL